MPTRRRFLQTAVGAATVLFTTRPAAAAALPMSLVEWFDEQMKEDPGERARMERLVAVARATEGDAARALQHYDGKPS